VVLLSAQLDPADVAQVQHAAGLQVAADVAGAEDDAVEFVGGDEPALGGDGELKALSRGRGRLTDLAGGYLDVLFLERGDDVVGTQTAGGQFFRVQPNAHAVVALADVSDIAHAGEPGQVVADVDGGVIADEQRVHVGTGGFGRRGHSRAGGGANDDLRL